MAGHVSDDVTGLQRGIGGGGRGRNTKFIVPRLAEPDLHKKWRGKTAD